MFATPIGKTNIEHSTVERKGCDRDEVTGDEDEEPRGVGVELESFKKQLRASNFRRLLLPLQIHSSFSTFVSLTPILLRHLRFRSLPVT